MGRRKLLTVPFVVLLLLPLPSLSQLRELTLGNVKVHVVYSDGRPLTTHARLQLMEGSSTNPMAETYTDDHGEAEFSGVSIGTYHIVVSGDAIQDADSGVLDVDQRRATQSIMITVRRTGEGEQRQQGGGATVSAADLHIPGKARDQFNKAMSLRAKQSWQKVVEKLQNAVTIYPQYVDAYNELGVAYSRLGNYDLERESLNKALSINDRYVPALLNLAVLDVRQSHSGEAETLLNKASVTDPTNVKVLAWLAQAQLLDGHYDAAISTAQRVHSKEHTGYAAVHYIAAHAFLHENRPQDAIAQFQMMLTEEPTGARADAVRKQLAALQTTSQ